MKITKPIYIAGVIIGFLAVIIEVFILDLLPSGWASTIYAGFVAVFSLIYHYQSRRHEPKKSNS